MTFPEWEKATCTRCRYSRSVAPAKKVAEGWYQFPDPFWCSLREIDVSQRDAACFEFKITRRLRARIRKNAAAQP